MKKFIYIFLLLAIGLFSAKSFSKPKISSDLTLIRSVKSHQTDISKLLLTPGQNTVEVFTPNKVNCWYLNKEGEIGYVGKELTHCIRSIELKENLDLFVEVDNLSNQDLDYKILIHNIK